MLKTLRGRIPLRLTRSMQGSTMTSALRMAALAATFFSLTSCGVGRNSPSEPAFSCDDVTGSYNATFSNSCGGSGSGIVIVAQVGCTFSALIPGFGGGTIAGEIRGSSATLTLFFCSALLGIRNWDGHRQPHHNFRNLHGRRHGIRLLQSGVWLLHSGALRPAHRRGRAGQRPDEGTLHRAEVPRCRGAMGIAGSL